MLEKIDNKLFYDGSLIYEAPSVIDYCYIVDKGVLVLYNNASSWAQDDLESAMYNCLMLSFDGKVLWRIKNFPDNPNDWVTLYKEDGKWFVGAGNEDECILNLEDGNVKYSHTSRAGTGLNRVYD